ncbi:MAG: DUF6515 family protein, partial [Mucilaginibacter sp.]
YYYGGIFYRQYNGGYEVTAPPVGASVPNLPSDAQSIVIDGVQYYEADGVYYQPDVDANGNTVYVVVGRDGVLNTGNDQASLNDQPMNDNDDPMMDAPAPTGSSNDNYAPQQDDQQTVSELNVKVGDIIDQLPPDCRQITLNKKKYYVSPDNIFYEDYKDANGPGYRVASVPSEAGQ